MEIKMLAGKQNFWGVLEIITLWMIYCIVPKSVKNDKKYVPKNVKLGLKFT